MNSLVELCGPACCYRTVSLLETVGILQAGGLAYKLDDPVVIGCREADVFNLRVLLQLLEHGDQMASSGVAIKPFTRINYI